jgi:hypothetical protein
MRKCNDPAVSAQVRPLKHTPQRVFSYPVPGEGAGCCKSKSNRQGLDGNPPELAVLT